MIAFVRRMGLFTKALLLLLFVTALATLEISLALSFKNDLKRDFGVVAEFDDRERDYLVGILVSSELGHELSIPEQGVVFLRVGLWLKRLSDLAEIEKTVPYQSTRPGVEPFASDVSDMRRMLDSAATNDDLAAFARRVKRKVSEYSSQLHVGVTEVRRLRAELVQQYGEKADRYSAILLGIGLGGFGVLVIVGGVFLTGLVGSLQQLEHRALEITDGAYGPPLDSNREDEIGEVIRSVNAMAASLERREKEIEDFRRRMFQQEKMFTIGSFAAGIAHEVGNPIQAVMALNAQIMESLMEDPSPENVEANMDSMSLLAEQAQRLSNVVGEIREFTHTGAPDKALCDINEVVHNTMRIMRFDKRFKNIALSAHLDPELPAVEAVADHVAQVLINLLINAADAVEREDGQVEITSNLDGREVVVEVADNGNGMSEEVLQRSMEPLFTTKERGKGTGMGLAVSKQIIDEHGGRLIISSKPGQGTTIAVRLPAKVERKDNEKSIA